MLTQNNQSNGKLQQNGITKTERGLNHSFQIKTNGPNQTKLKYTLKTINDFVDFPKFTNDFQLKTKEVIL